MRGHKTTFILALALTTLSWSAAAQQRPNVSGTWKMNPEKSSFERGGPKALTVKFEQQGGTLTEALTINPEQGEERTINLTYTLDGKESVQKVNGQDMKAMAKWEADYLLIEFKNDEGFSFTRRITLSADKKTMTMGVTQVNPGGTANDTVVLEKQ